MKLMKRSNYFITVIIISWFLQGCAGTSESEGPVLKSTIEKSDGGEKLYRKSPASEGVFAPQNSPSTDLDGGISGTGHDKKLDQGNAF
ncbi:MAG: hypothetical protein KAI22_01740 [Gammaproteobacteria bacterium]|nr:hypothetical protein [Gammaproteobacteria bacterium]